MADPHFVVQHHLATADHYDFRLEIDGVLVSWAVPKGPSTDPAQRRLAKRVSDHSMDYELYEGVLSTQRRGGGVVQVWDRGTYRNVSADSGVAAVGRRRAGTRAPVVRARRREDQRRLQPHPHPGRGPVAADQEDATPAPTRVATRRAREPDRC